MVLKVTSHGVWFYRLPHTTDDDGQPHPASSISKQELTNYWMTTAPLKVLIDSPFAIDPYTICVTTNEPLPIESGCGLNDVPWNPPLDSIQKSSSFNMLSIGNPKYLDAITISNFKSDSLCNYVSYVKKLSNVGIIFINI